MRRLACYTTGYLLRRGVAEGVPPRISPWSSLRLILVPRVVCVGCRDQFSVPARVWTSLMRSMVIVWLDLGGNRHLPSVWNG